MEKVRNKMRIGEKSSEGCGRQNCLAVMLSMVTSGIIHETEMFPEHEEECDIIRELDPLRCFIPSDEVSDFHIDHDFFESNEDSPEVPGEHFIDCTCDPRDVHITEPEKFKRRTIPFTFMSPNGKAKRFKAFKF